MNIRIVLNEQFCNDANCNHLTFKTCRVTQKAMTFKKSSLKSHIMWVTLYFIETYLIKFAAVDTLILFGSKARPESRTL